MDGLPGWRYFGGIAYWAMMGDEKQGHPHTVWFDAASVSVYPFWFMLGSGVYNLPVVATSRDQTEIVFKKGSKSIFPAKPVMVEAFPLLGCVVDSTANLPTPAGTGALPMAHLVGIKRRCTLYAWPKMDIVTARGNGYFPAPRPYAFVSARQIDRIACAHIVQNTRKQV